MTDWQTGDEGWIFRDSLPFNHLDTFDIGDFLIHGMKIAYFQS